MNKERRGKMRGRTITEWISTVPGELGRDAVNLCQILSAGQHEYELDGDELINFVRQCLVSLFEAGARPVLTSSDWTFTPKYGESEQEIVESVIAEWLSSHGDEIYPWTVWFARPSS